MKFIHLFKKKKLKHWITENAEGAQSTTLLSSISFSESIFFPIPPDVILIAIISARKKTKWAYYATITTISSTLGGISGYMIGALLFKFLGQPVITFYGLESQYKMVFDLFHQYDALAVFLGALTPIPYKLFTLGSGVFGINIFVFILASVLGRGIRFFTVAYIMKIWGHKIAHVVYKHFNLFSFITVIIMALVVYVLY
jgi:membrane protein YqaA with SNARE-associated domain